MPHSLTISPPQRLSQDDSSTVVLPSDTIERAGENPGATSPVAPEYSPISPKVQPPLPILGPTTNNDTFVPPENGGTFTFSASSDPPGHHAQAGSDESVGASSSSAQFIPQPPPLPFSSDDASDAIALRAAISTLQFQRKKAQDDLKTLARIKKLAVENPVRFKEELASGNLKEHVPTIGDLRAILDESDSDEADGNDDDDDDNGDDNDYNNDNDSEARDASDGRNVDMDNNNKPKPFPRIPGPQNVVRMPPVSWDKYGIVGEPLEKMHAQQLRWPGSPAYGQNLGREHAVAAPYSPFLDTLEAQQKQDPTGLRKDSAAAAALASARTSSEHPMETRSRT